MRCSGKSPPASPIARSRRVATSRPCTAPPPPRSRVRWRRSTTPRESRPATMHLAHRFDDVGQLDDALLAGTLASGRIASLAAMLGVRAGIPFDDSRAMLTDAARFAVLLRACDIERDLAAAMILALALGLDRGFGPDPADAAAALIEGYAALPVDRARAGRAPGSARAAISRCTRGAGGPSMLSPQDSPRSWPYRCRWSPDRRGSGARRSASSRGGPYRWRARGAAAGDAGAAGAPSWPSRWRAR